MNDKASDVAKRIADELASCDVKLVASLPDNWLMGVIKAIDRDERFVHVPVNREESAIGLCSGAYMGAMGSAALMGASGFMTVIYAITKINYTYEIPLFLMLTLARGRRRPPQASHLQRPLSAAGAGCNQFALSGHRRSRRHRVDLTQLSSHADIFPPDGGSVHARSAAGARMKYLDAFRTLAKHRKRRDRGHVGRKLRPGLVGRDAGHRGDVLSRCVDEPVDHVFVRPGAGAA